MDINGEPDVPPTRVGSTSVIWLPRCLPLPAFWSRCARSSASRQGLLPERLHDGHPGLLCCSWKPGVRPRCRRSRCGPATTDRSGPNGQYAASVGAIIITAACDDQWLATLLRHRHTSTSSRTSGSPAIRSVRRNAARARAEVQARIGKMTRSEALECLSAGDVHCEPVRTVPEILADPHIRDPGLRCVRCSTPPSMAPWMKSLTGFPVLFDGQPLPDVVGAPSLGMHNAEFAGTTVRSSMRKG